MSESIIIAGATGLIGSEFVSRAEESPLIGNFYLFTRREISVKNEKISSHTVDFDNPSTFPRNMKAESAVCALGTTISKAGSKENFRKVDFVYVLSFAKFAKEIGVKNFVVVSSVNADPDSKTFYLKTKGEMEESIKKLQFESLDIIRPSLLLGKRNEYRFGEEVSKFLSHPVKKLIPWKYRPIDASKIAEKILRIIKSPPMGINVFEGKSIYQ